VAELPTRGEALRKAVEFAERAYASEEATRAEYLGAITAYATLSQAWTAIAREIGEGGR
jgi:hypothetical protein